MISSFDEFLTNIKPEHGLVGDPTYRLDPSNFEQKGSEFKVKSWSYGGAQYAQMYFVRFQQMKQILLKKLQKESQQAVGISSLQGGQQCNVIGTVYKSMKLRPSVMDEYSDDKKDIQKNQFFGQHSDELILEDETSRMKVLIQGYTPLDFVTGQVVCLQGYLTEDRSHFEGNSIIWAGPAMQQPRSLDIAEDQYILLISGIGIGRQNSRPLCLDLWLDYVKGALGSSCDASSISGKIVRAIVVGNSVADVEYIAGSQNGGMDFLMDLDRYLTELLGYIPVDIMPGISDPVNIDFPQQPLHHCLFPVSSTYNHFNLVTNPYTFNQNGINFTGSSGQNIDDMLRYADFRSFETEGSCQEGLACDALIRCGHLAPTAPDTLGCHLFVDEDPFIMREAPHVLFVGNQKKFHTHEYSEAGVKVRVVCVPQFCTTQQAVLLNLKNMRCFPINIQGEQD